MAILVAIDVILGGVSADSQGVVMPIRQVRFIVTNDLCGRNRNEPGAGQIASVTIFIDLVTASFCLRINRSVAFSPLAAGTSLSSRSAFSLRGCRSAGLLGAIYALAAFIGNAIAIIINSVATSFFGLI